MGTGSGTEGGQSLIRTVPAGASPHSHDAIDSNLLVPLSFLLRAWYSAVAPSSQFFPLPPKLSEASSPTLSEKSRTGNH